MKITNITAPDRRTLVKAIAENTGMEPNYAGPPTFNYTVGDITIDRDSAVEVPEKLVDGIKALLISSGWLEPEPEAEPAPERMTIWLPVDDMTSAQITNLIHMLYSKQYLLGRSVGEACIRIEDAVIARLREYTPETQQVYAVLIGDCLALGEIEGFELADGKIRMDFPLTSDAETFNTYSLLATRILKAAKEATRVFPEKLVTESEKYYMRGWLLRLGFGGPEHKAARSLLLKDLKGHSAFPNDEKAKQHTERWAIIRKEKREAKLAADSEAVPAPVAEPEPAPEPDPALVTEPAAEPEEAPADKKVVHHD